MQALIELIIGFIAMLAAAVLAQFGVELDARDRGQREIHRVSDNCGDDPAARIIAATERRKDC